MYARYELTGNLSILVSLFQDPDVKAKSEIKAPYQNEDTSYTLRIM